MKISGRAGGAPEKIRPGSHAEAPRGQKVEFWIQFFNTAQKIGLQKIGGSLILPKILEKLNSVHYSTGGLLFTTPRYLWVGHQGKS